ncbi:MAG: YbaB/EbfC family nucleoid-associated protein [Bacilli bacterium]|nr:YbaB/EbfC family nucleoid-associated protein [Bacilli bacterium]
MNPQQMRKIRQMQQEIMKAQDEIAKSTFTKSAGGVVSVTVQGTGQLLKVEIDESFTIESKEDTEMLGEMIVAAYNAAHDEVEKFTEEKLGKYQAMLGGSMF